MWCVSWREGNQDLDTSGLAFSRSVGFSAAGTGASRQQQPQLSWRPKSYPQLHNSHFVLSKPDLSSKYWVNANVVDVFSSTLQAEPHKSDQTAELADVSHLHNAPLITKSHSKFCTLGSVQAFGNNSWSQSNNCRQQLNLSWPPNLMNGFHI